MKKIIFALLTSIITLSGNATPFKIEGEIKGLTPGDTLSFERITLPGFKRDFAFEVIVENEDEFSYSGSHEHIGYYAMTYKPISGKVAASDRMAMTMLIENGTTRLIGTTEQIYHSQLKGGLYENDLLQEAIHLEDSLAKERGGFGRLIEEAYALKDTVKAKEYADKFNSFHFNHKEDYQRLSKLKEEFYDKFPSSEHTLLSALQRVISVPLETTEEKYEKMDEEAKNSHFGIALKQELDKITALQPGEKAPDFHLIGLNGDEITLEECAGSYVLIYHWGLCPGSLMIDSKVIELHNKYKDHLIVVGVTDRIESIESMYEKTKAGSKLMNIELKPVLENMLAHPWFDAEKVGGNEKIDKNYAFAGLPYFVFISPKGEIIARDFHKAFYAAKEKMEAEFGK